MKLQSHSFATNLHSAKLPMPYISDAMGHSLGNRGQITMRYISPYTIDERIKYNNVLMGLADSPKLRISLLGRVPFTSETGPS